MGVKAGFSVFNPNSQQNMEENEYTILILRRLSRQTSPAEEARLQHWLDADPVNLLEYQSVEKTWQDCGSVLHHRTFDQKAAWEKIDPLRAVSPAISTTRAAHPQRSIARKTMLAAASILLVLSSAAWWYYTTLQRSSFRLITAEHVNREITLPDGSSVFLRKGATLRYPGSFNSTVREVELTGEAFFQLAHDPSKPFRVRTAHAIIEDIGTSFLVKNQGPRDEVIVTTGKIKLIDRNDTSNSVVITPGDKAILKENTPINAVERVTGTNFMSWKTQILDFRETPMEQVVQDVNEYYRVPLAIDPACQAEAAKIRMTAHFDNQPLKEVLDEIRLTTGLDTRQEKDILVFFRK
jgi:ferric-dicitrate binding protein FerR (iron transport regulator)